jgi:hypothetical protein
MSPAALVIGPPVAAEQSKYGKTLPPLEAIGHRGVSVGRVPMFESYSSQRQWTWEHLAGAFRVLGREGNAEGIVGHISVRDPEFSDRFWINPLGVHFSMMKVSDLICLDMQGNVVAGNKVSILSAALACERY